MALEFLRDDSCEKLAKQMLSNKKLMEEGIIKSSGIVTETNEISYEEALQFYSDNTRRVSIDPEGFTKLAKKCRNVLIRNNNWCKEYQDRYDNIKSLCIKNGYMSDINEFEKDELKWAY